MFLFLLKIVLQRDLNVIVRYWKHIDCGSIKKIHPNWIERATKHIYPNYINNINAAFSYSPNTHWTINFSSMNQSKNTFQTSLISIIHKMGILNNSKSISMYIYDNLCVWKYRTQKHFSPNESSDNGFKGEKYCLWPLWWIFELI